MTVTHGVLYFVSIRASAIHVQCIMSNGAEKTI